MKDTYAFMLHFREKILKCINEMFHFRCGCIVAKNMSGLALGLTLSLGLGNSVSAADACDVSPLFFCEEFQTLASDIPKQDLDQMRATEPRVAARTKIELQLHIRNRFELWQDNPTTRFFRAHRVNVPDFMSFVMIEAFVHYLNNKSIDMGAFCATAIIEATPPPPPPEPKKDGQPPNSNMCRVSPPRFCETYASLKGELSASVVEKIKTTPRKDVDIFHMTIGMQIRNQFALWQTNETTRFFNSLGVQHPDLMSHILLEGFVDYLNDRPVDISALSRAALEIPPPPLPPTNPSH